MTLIHLYIWNQKLIIPNVACTDEGVFVDLDPICILDIVDKAEWSNAIWQAVQRGNELIETPERFVEPGSSILDKLNIRKWSTFEHDATMYTLQFGSRYTSIYRTRKSPDGHWLNLNTEPRRFDRHAPLELILDAVVADLVKQPETKPPPTGLVLVPKSASH